MDIDLVEERVAVLNSREPTQDSHEELFRMVLVAIATGAANPTALAAAAIKAK